MRTRRTQEAEEEEETEIHSYSDKIHRLAFAQNGQQDILTPPHLLFLIWLHLQDFVVGFSAEPDAIDDEQDHCYHPSEGDAVRSMRSTRDPGP